MSIPVRERDPRTYAYLDIDTIADLRRVAFRAEQIRGLPRHFGARKFGAASIVVQCLNTLAGDLADGTVRPAEVCWREPVPRLVRREMLHLSDPDDELGVLAAALDVPLDRAFINGVTAWAIARYLPEIRAALAVPEADVRRLERALVGGVDRYNAGQLAVA